MFLCTFFTIYHQARIYKTCSVLPAPVTAVKRAFGIWCLYVLLHLCNCVLFVCWRRGGSTGPWETGGLTRMYGCFKIHLQAFFYCHSPLLSAHNTPHPISKKYTGTCGNSPLPITSTGYSILPVLTNNQTRAWNPQQPWSEHHLNPWNRGNLLLFFFTSLFSCLNSDLNRVCASLFRIYES